MRILIASFLAIVVLASCGTSTEKNNIITTDGGYRYEMIKKGSGEKAIIDNYAYFNAEVVCLEGDMVFSTTASNQPGIMKLVAVDPVRPSPFSDILLRGNVGDSIHIYLGKGQGVEGSGFDSLIYKIGFYEMLGEEEYKAKLDAERAKNEIGMEKIKKEESAIADKVAKIYKDYKAGNLSTDVQETETGLKYIVHEKGTGAITKAGEKVGVNYYGILSRNGEMFDNSWKRGQAFAFPLGQGRVIKGWDQGLALLERGTIATLIIPSDLGYGNTGSGKIQAGDELMFYIEVQE